MRSAGSVQRQRARRGLRRAAARGSKMAMAAPLRPGDAFPALEVTTTDGRTLRVPADLPGRYAVVLYYRAWW